MKSTEVPGAIIMMKGYVRDVQDEYRTRNKNVLHSNPNSDIDFFS